MTLFQLLFVSLIVYATAAETCQCYCSGGSVNVWSPNLFFFFFPQNVCWQRIFVDSCDDCTTATCAANRLGCVSGSAGCTRYTCGFAEYKNFTDCTGSSRACQAVGGDPYAGKPLPRNDCDCNQVSHRCANISGCATNELSAAAYDNCLLACPGYAFCTPPPAAAASSSCPKDWSETVCYRAHSTCLLSAQSDKAVCVCFDAFLKCTDAGCIPYAVVNGVSRACAEMGCASCGAGASLEVPLYSFVAVPILFLFVGLM